MSGQTISGLKKAMSSTVTVRISGGLGNQLFQYAAGRALALRTGASLALDIRPVEKSRSRSFALAPFAHAGQIADRKILPPAGGPALWWWRRRGGRNIRVHAEKSFAFDPAVNDLSGDVYLNGYFQSELYFTDRADDIRHDIRIAGGFGKAAEAVSHRIVDVMSVSLHIRRGDYVSNPKAARIHGALDLAYYRRAAEHMTSRVGGESHFFVFTDDPDWTRANLNLPGETVIVSGDGMSDQEELMLMARCRHHIIANSSFSWWGAWLNPREDKIVLAPQPWFADRTRDEGDLIPSGWTRIAASP